MSSIKFTSSPGLPHGSFAEEWLCHKKGSEWWYVTGTLTDGETGGLYSFQYTLVKPQLAGVSPFILMTALTDFQSGKHYYSQQTLLGKSGIVINGDCAAVAGAAALLLDGGKPSRLKINAAEFALDLAISPNKAPVWHCDGGELAMGITGVEKERTYYYSYTNNDVEGVLLLGGEKKTVRGKCWIDKQGGGYSLINGKTHWEWFSLRFDDGEEAMLFSFPQDKYRDGSYIKADGSVRRLNDYTIEPLDFTQAAGMVFSCKWRVRLPGVKGEEYTIVPKTDGQLNLAYFELLADIIDAGGGKVGVCFVELLPGVYNQKFKVVLFKKA
jgi:predicted secreted hydrolase